MDGSRLRFLGAELYFDDLEGARAFYDDVLGLKVSDEEQGHYARFAGSDAFVCLERRGSESYPSRDKAALFFEVSDLEETITAIGPERIVGGARDRDAGRRWAVLHDPEGHNVVLVERS